MNREFEPRGNVHIDQEVVAPKQMRTLAKTPLDNQFRIIPTVQRYRGFPPFPLLILIISSFKRFLKTF